MLAGIADGAWAYCKSSSCPVFLPGCLAEVCLGQEDSEAIMMSRLRKVKGGLVACHKGAFLNSRQNIPFFLRGLQGSCHTTQTDCGIF